tara:strand:+ start:2388 stop:3062 length:675 start_codon:yes stop_codon:yes gene_type:complete
LNIAIIPARGGSKRIPKKNIKNFCGKPLILYSIETAIESNLFDDIIVSTDSKEIASLAKKNGATVKSYRSYELSDDFATTGEVMAYEASLIDKYASAVCCIYATAPFIKCEDLIKSFKIFQNKKCDYVFSATQFNYPIQRAFKLLKTGGIDMIESKNYNSRSQDLPLVYHDAGQFYWGSISSWTKNKKIFSKNSFIYELPTWRVQDIDTFEDWKRAELLYKTIN